MNGRVYDPLVSRFLSPDLFVQAPGNPQSFNRYAYVFNNPLSYTDPSGYIGIPQQWSESPVQEVDNSWFWMNHNPLNPGFGGGSGSGSSFGNSQTGYGLPGFGGNGTGVNGIYYDWVSGAYRYVSNPGRVVIGGFWLDVPLSEKVNEGLNGKLPGRWIIGGGIRSIYVNQGLGVGDDASSDRGLDAVSTIFGATGVGGDIASSSNSTFRIKNGANGIFSPKIYWSGWKGGSPARIATYSVSKVGGAVSFGSSVITTGNAYYYIATGQKQPIIYVDATVGTAGIMSTIASYYAGVQIPYLGEFVAVYGTFRLTWDVFYNLGANYGPSKWYGTDDTRWFK